MAEVQTLAPTGVRWEEGSKHRDQRTISGCSHCQERFVRSGTQPEKIPHSGPLLGEPLQSATLAALPDLTLLPEQFTSAHAMLHGRKIWMLQSMSDVWVTRYASSVTDSALSLSSASLPAGMVCLEREACTSDVIYQPADQV